MKVLAKLFIGLENNESNGFNPKVDVFRATLCRGISCPGAWIFTVRDGSRGMQWP